MQTLARLIEEELAARGWRRSQLAAAMGYTCLSRGLRRLQALEAGDCTNREALRRLGRALALPEARLAAVVQATQAEAARTAARLAAEAEATARARFRPYLYVKTSITRPQFITAAAAIGPRLKYLPLADDDLVLPRAALIARAGEVAREHFARNLGRCLLFGEITGYQFRIAWEETVVLDIDGRVLAERAGRPDEDGQAALTVGHRTLRDGLFSLV